jgi:hypothetical protein
MFNQYDNEMGKNLNLADDSFILIEKTFMEKTI